LHFSVRMALAGLAQFRDEICKPQVSLCPETPFTAHWLTFGLAALDWTGPCGFLGLARSRTARRLRRRLLLHGRAHEWLLRPFHIGSQLLELRERFRLVP